MRTYGQQVTHISRETGEPAVFSAFLQPVLKEREMPPVTATPLGAVSSKRWLYVGPAGREMRPGDRIHFDTLRLVVQEAETIFFHSTAVYCRAILRREREAAE